MQSREIVRRSLSFEGAPRIPMSLPGPYPNDFVSAGIEPAPDWQPNQTWSVGRETRWKDEWGNTWARLDDLSKGEVAQGAIQDWAELDSYIMPTFDDPQQYAKARERFAAHPERYRMGGLPGFPFAIMRYLRRMDIFLADLLLHPHQVRRLAERVVELLVGCMDNWARVEADGVMFCEDWGTQERLLVSPRMWRDLFKPDFGRLCAAARQRGLRVWMHSCGYIWDIIPDLVECGIAVLQLDQPGLFGVERLARHFGGRINFWCPVDIQRVLPTGDLDLIESFARELVEKLGGFGRDGRWAGFVAGYYGSNEAIGVRPEWQDHACRAFVKYGAATRTHSAGSGQAVAE
jgi:hypothetical protein